MKKFEQDLSRNRQPSVDKDPSGCKTEFLSNFAIRFAGVFWDSITLKTNIRMRELLADSLTEIWRPSLPRRAQAIAEAGWIIGPNAALLLRAMYGNSWSGEFDPSEIGHYEYEVNDVYISLSDLREDTRRYLPRAASRGLFFARRMLRDASALEGGDRLLALVSIFADEDDDDFLLQGATVKFFSRRGAYPDWFEDLEGFRHEAIAILDLDDVAGF